jgi:hypothetical protein
MAKHFETDHIQQLEKKKGRLFGFVIIIFFASTNPYKHGEEP